MSGHPGGGITRRHSGWWLLVAIVPGVVAVGVLVWSAQPWRGLNADGPLVLVAGVLLETGVVLPYVLLGLVLWLLRLPHPLPWWLVTGYGAVMGAAGIWGYIDIVRSESSTAALGFLVLPVVQLAGLALVLVPGLVFSLVGSRRRRPGPARMEGPVGPQRP